MRLTLLLMLGLLRCGSVGGPASEPVAAALAAPGATKTPATMPAYAMKPLALVAPVLGAAVGASKAAGSYPGLDGVAVRELLAGAELELGDRTAERDRALEKAKLAESFGQSQALEVTRTKVIAVLIGVGAALLAGCIGFLAGEAAAGKWAPRTTLQGDVVLEPLRAWQHAAGAR